LKMVGEICMRSFRKVETGTAKGGRSVLERADFR